MGRAEVLGVRRVRDLAVESDDVAAHVAERGDRLAVRLARRDLLAVLPRRQVAAGGLEAVRLRAVASAWRRPRSGALAASAAIASSGSSSGLPCLPGWSSTALTPLPFLCARRSPSPARVLGPRRRRPRSASTSWPSIAIASSQRPGALDVAVEVPADHRLARLAEAVDVDDPVRLSSLRSRRAGRPPTSSPRPSRSRRTGTRRGNPTGRAAGREGDADADRQAWPSEPVATSSEGSPARGGPSAVRGAWGTSAAPRRDRAAGLQHCGEQRRGVALGEDQVVVAGFVGFW